MAKAVLIVDDNAYIRQALCEVFTCEADFEVCGEALIPPLAPTSSHDRFCRFCHRVFCSLRKALFGSSDYLNDLLGAISFLL